MKKNLTKAVKTGIVYFVSILSDRKTSNGLVLVSTGVLKFGKPFVDSGTASSTWNLNLNADDNYVAYAA